MNNVVAFIITAMVLVAVITAGNAHHTVVATVRMDGLGYYRLTNYTVSADKCIQFTDFVGERVRFCGAYELTTEDEHYEQLVQSLPYSRPNINN